MIFNANSREFDRFRSKRDLLKDFLNEKRKLLSCVRSSDDSKKRNTQDTGWFVTTFKAISVDSYQK